MLTAAKVKAAKGPAKLYDRDGLILRVTASGAKRWCWRGTVRGRRVELGLGSARFLTLREAREAAFDHTRTARRGDDPRQARRHAPTVAEALNEVIRVERSGWKTGASTEDQWRRMARRYVLPVIGSYRIDEVEMSDVVRMLRPIWRSKPAAGRRLRQILGAMLEWSVAAGHRADNPAKSVAALLPKVSGKTRHARFLPPLEVPGALAKIRADADSWPGVRLLIQFQTLTACRPAEARGATWTEVDPESAVWTVPANRTKTNREHRIPLSGAALQVLDRARQLTGEEGYVFQSARAPKPIVHTTVNRLLKRLDIDSVAHGFRSSFRSWAAEEGFSRELAETCLGHAFGNQVEQAYQRSDLLEQRADLMERWGQHCGAG